MGTPSSKYICCRKSIAYTLRDQQTMAHRPLVHGHTYSFNVLAASVLIENHKPCKASTIYSLTLYRKEFAGH